MEKRLIDVNKLVWGRTEDINGEYLPRITAKDIEKSSTVLTIPENPTNGDMIKAIFPNIDIRLFTDANIVQTKIQEFDSYWWNAPYKAESEVKE